MILILCDFLLRRSEKIKNIEKHRVLIIFSICLLLLLLLTEFITFSYALTLESSAPVSDKIDLYELRDQTYYFPANYASNDKTIFLPLQRWDLIFTGDHINKTDDTMDRENINYVIPGPFNHLMVYMGKDAKGLAYAIELNIASLEEGGGLSLICLGSDFGIFRHPDTQHIHNKRMMRNRWAMRFIEAAYNQLRTHEDLLFSRLQNDLAISFPYQFEIQHSGQLWDRYIYLIDDGFEGGASCSDYWTTLFEVYAGLCIKNVRMSVQEMVEYIRNSPEGRLAYVPPEVSPFSTPVLVSQLLDMGFQIVPDGPHIDSCDGTEETGLVLPSLIMQSDQLEEINELHLPFPVF